MPRRRWVYPSDGSPPYEITGRRERGRHHFVIGDSLDPHVNHKTGEVVDSRTRHNQILREYGMVEIGNETTEFMKVANTNPFSEPDTSAVTPQLAKEILSGV